MGSNTLQLVYDIGNRRYINLGKHCTLKCTFCPKTLGDHHVHQYDLSLPAQPDVQSIIAKLGDPSQFEEIVFCGYSEPTLRLKELIDIAQHIKKQGGRVRVNTDGLANLVYKRNVLPELANCIDALSISLNAQNEELYIKHCQPGLPNAFAALLLFIEEAVKTLDDVTVTAIDGLTGVDIDACEKLTTKRGAVFRRRVLDIVG